MDHQKLYINGEWTESKSGEFIEVENPATREVMDKVPRANKQDVDYAVKAAKEAFETWQYTDLEERISLMKDLQKELEKRKDDMVDCIAKELGRSKGFALNPQVAPQIESFDSFIELTKEYEFERRFDGFMVKKEPFGVVAAITPWNYPLSQVTKKVIPALLTGNTVVLKPSQQTPLVAYILTDAIDKVGFPKGVFNLVTGTGTGSEVGDMLSNHKDVDMVSFTGSVDAGRKVDTAAIDGIKKVTLELGGKSPAIILKGGDIDLAIKKTLNTVYNNTGQTCSAYTRLLVPEDQKEEIEKRVIEMTKEYKFGDPKTGDKVIGPVVSKKQFDKVVSYIEKGVAEGATPIHGGIPKDYNKGYYVGPVVFTDVKNDMEIAQNETFGPVLSIITYKDKEEALKIANDIDYGLAGAVFGPEEEALEFAKKIKARNILVNDGKGGHKAPFGGYKNSGLGREDGVEGIEEFLQTKTIYI
ncbi:aldehyde dehydrogenase family protein [Clostridium sp. D2Q-11]|uniref:aldehyde dehydrogenase (NAD(+)) n=1 Tax=Anaeromonas frigoriresistens TaxID=2683708 RepID=A0A942UTR8_9FIRM|nr:aldehyde dehydrogenase family protein [Anaeromonas frigoriresistens]MBS4538423.1 aldehyde dehydrogenase family protein [Anaeromonas frigoriresistens]